MPGGRRAYPACRTALICLALAGRLSGEPDGEASVVAPVPIYDFWEGEDLAPARPNPPSIAEPLDAYRGVLLWAIGLYQTRIGPRSVKRCPFYVSCSDFARLAVQRCGPIAGTAMFIDRNLYREHPMASAYYPLREDAAGALKLDDGFFLQSCPSLGAGLGDQPPTGLPTIAEIGVGW